MPIVTIRLTSEADPIPRKGETVICSPLSQETSTTNVGARVVLPPIPEELRDQYLRLIRKTLASLARENSNEDWWYLPISELQPHMSSMLSALELEAQIITLVANLKDSGSPYHFVLPVLDVQVGRYLFDVDMGCKVTAGAYDRICWAIDRGKDLYRRTLNGVIWGCLHGVSVLFSASGPKLCKVVDTLFVSRLEGCFEPPNDDAFQTGWEDLYLGGMVEEGLKCGQEVAMLVRCGGHERMIEMFCSQYSRFPIRTIHQMLTLFDIVHILFRAFRLRLRAPNSSPLFRLIVGESRNHVRAVADCILVEIAMRRLLERVKPRQIVCMQENSTWENAVVVAARTTAPEARLVGYFHCPVMPSAFRYHEWPEVKGRPMFDNIVPLGDAMARALCKLGNWEHLLWPGYGFRNPDIERQLSTPVSRPRKPFHIVVLLGGMFDNALFLKWVNAARLGLPETKLLIKGHPVYGSKLAIKGAKITVAQKGDIQDISSLSIFEAFREADCVVYKGTTVGIAALAAGIPAIHVDHGGLQTDDTLFDSDGLAQSVRDSVEFQSAILKLMEMSEADRLDWSARARKYAANYYNLSVERRTQVLEKLFDQAVLQNSILGE